MKTHKLINDFTKIDEEYLLHALGKENGSENTEARGGGEPMVVRGGRTSPLKIFLPLAGAAAAIALLVPLGVNIMRQRNSGGANAPVTSFESSRDSASADSIINSSANVTASNSQATSADVTSGAAPSVTVTDPAYSTSPDAPTSEPALVSVPEVSEPGASVPETSVGTPAANMMIVMFRSHVEGAVYPDKRFINSLAELEAAFGGVLKGLETFDDGFFSKYSLVLVRDEEGSGSVKLAVRDVHVHGSSPLTVGVYIEREVPEVGTCDMAYWHILIPIDKSLAENGSVITVNYETVM